MKKIIYVLSALALVAALVVPSLAETNRLKDGSVIRGDVVGFKDQQFIVLIGAGAKGRRSRTTIYVEDIESIEFDSSQNAGVSQPDESSSPNTNTAANDTPSQPARTDNGGPAPRTRKHSPSAERRQRSSPSGFLSVPTTQTTVGRIVAWLCAEVSA